MVLHHELKGQRASGIITTALSASINTSHPQLNYSFPFSLSYLSIKTAQRPRRSRRLLVPLGSQPFT